MNTVVGSTEKDLYSLVYLLYYGNESQQHFHQGMPDIWNIHGSVVSHHFFLFG